jgi:hypothetical protein
LDQLTEYLKSKEIPFVTEDKFVFACGFVFYKFQEHLACNNPKGDQFLDLTLNDAERLIKRQIRKVPSSLTRPLYRQ